MELRSTGCALRAILLALLAGLAATAGAQVPNLERGRTLYENHCQVCHTPTVHSRANRLPIDAAELREIVDGWQKSENLRWNAEDVDDVVHYLRQTRYRF